MRIYKERLLGVDFLRFVCASLVFTAHFIITYFDETDNLYWKNLIHNTKYATEIFFVISGFVIAKISSEVKYSESIFILKRFYRIFIIGYVIIFLLNPTFFLSKIVDCYNYNNYFNIPWFLSFDDKQICLASYAPGVSWTIIVEVYFYIFFSIFFFRKFKNNNFINIFENKLKNLIILIIFTLSILRFFLDLIYYNFGSFIYENRNHIFFSHFDSFFYGIISYIFLKKIILFKNLNLILITNTFIIFIFFLVLGDTLASRPLASFLGLNLLLYFYYNELKFRGILKFFSLLGKASFIFYITHMYLIQKFTSLLENYNSFFIIYSCIWLISLMLYVLVEVPLNRLSNFIFKKYHS